MKNILIYVLTILLGIGFSFGGLYLWNNRVEPSQKSPSVTIPTVLVAPTASVPTPTTLANKKPVEFGKEVRLTKNETAELSTSVSIKIVDFIYSPCPTNAQCFWSGLGVHYVLTVNGVEYESKIGNSPEKSPYLVTIKESDYKTYAVFVVVEK